MDGYRVVSHITKVVLILSIGAKICETVVIRVFTDASQVPSDCFKSVEGPTEKSLLAAKITNTEPSLPTLPEKVQDLFGNVTPNIQDLLRQYNFNTDLNIESLQMQASKFLSETQSFPSFKILDDKNDDESYRDNNGFIDIDHFIKAKFNLF